MNKPAYYLIAICLLFLQACKIDAPEFPDPGTAPVASSSYLPLTKGTYWKYVSDLSPDTSTVRVTGETTTIKGLQYHNVTSTLAGQTSPGFYYYDQHVMIIRASTLVNGFTINMQILNDTSAIDHTWTVPLTDNGTLNDVPARLVGSVKEKGITKIVGKKTFADVIHTHLLLQYDYGIGSGFETSAEYDMYIAKGVGLIQTDTQIFNLTTTSRLVDYSIK